MITSTKMIPPPATLIAEERASLLDSLNVRPWTTSSYTLMFNWLSNLSSISPERTSESARAPLFSLFSTIAEKSLLTDS